MYTPLPSDVNRKKKRIAPTDEILRFINTFIIITSKVIYIHTGHVECRERFCVNVWKIALPV